MYGIALLNAEASLLVLVGPEARVLPALAFGTTHGEVRRAYGPMPRGMSAQDVADHYASAWSATNVKIREWTA